MTFLEQISVCQRMTGSIKTDVEAGKTASALGKIELLEGELGLFRQGCEETNSADAVEAAPADVVDVSLD